MRTLPLRRDLGLQLLALSVLFIGLVVAGTLLFESLASQRLEADVKEADLALARAIAQETNITMRDAMDAVRQLAQELSVLAADPQGMEPIFRSAMEARPDVNLIYRLDADGTMLFHYPIGPETTVDVDFSFRDYFQRALTSREPLVSKGRISPTTNQAVATAVMPLWSASGEFLGLVGTNVKLQSLSQTLEDIVAEYSADEIPQLFTLDASGQIIAHSNPDLLLEDATGLVPDVYNTVLGGEAGNVVAPNADGQETLYSYVPIRSVGWGVVVSRPTAVAFATPSLFRRAAFISVVFILMGGLFFWLGQSRYFVQPLARLAAFSQSIAQDGTFPEEQERALRMDARRPDQIGHLTRSMQRMQKSIGARLDELSTLLQTSTAVVSTLDQQVVLDRILEQVEHLLGVRMCAIYALDESRGSFTIQASRGLAEWYTEHTIIDPAEPDSVTMRAIRCGEPVQISDTETNPSFKMRRSKARAAGYRSVLAAPLNTHFAPPSALLVFRPDVHEFSKREISLLSSFANHAAMAIENATLYTRSDMRLQEQTRRLEALIQSMHDGLILEDPDGQVLYANRRIEELSSLTTAQIATMNVMDLMGDILSRARDPQAAGDAVSEALQEGGSRRAEFALEMPEQTSYLRLRVFDVTDPQGARIGRGRILRDITQRRRLDRMKSSLISTVSHELRTPLASIKGYASTLLADDVEWDASSQREFLDIISVEADHLGELVTDLLDMSRIEAGNLTVSRQACQLGELVEQAARRAHPAPRERLHVELPPNLPALYVDPQRIEVVLRNLIENATKYSDEESPVWVRGIVDDHTLTVRVEDQGPGIPGEHNTHIFESFYRVEDGLTRSKPGAGLGLTIAQGFVRAHGGEIWIEPQPKGTTVAFSLPLAVV